MTGKKPIVRKQFVAAMKAKGHVTEDVPKMGGGVAYYDIEFVDSSDSSDSEYTTSAPRRTSRAARDSDSSRDSSTRV